MASTYSALKIELIATGEQSGTWGATTNVNLGDAALGEAITGSADVAFSSADVTITLTDTNTTQAARNLRLNLTGTSGGARNLILGSGCQIEKLYLVNNGLADAVTVKNTSGTGIAVPAGKTMFVYNNGTNVVEAVNSAVTLDATTIDTTNLEVTNIKAKDGTASSTIANSTGVMTVASSVLTTTDINGGTIDGTTIGVSSASTGAFTTLTSNGATTFTAGTASTSTTTGTAVVTGGLGVSGRVNAANFDGIVGANTAAAGSFTTINASTSITNAGLTSGRVTYAGTAGLLQDSANLTFNGTTLTASTGANFVTTSGSVGVGTASPQALLHVGSVAEAPGFGTTTQMCYVNGTSQPEVLIRETTNDVVVSMYADSTSGSIRTATNHPLVFFTNNTDRMRLDSSGNLGLGVTPSDWYAPATYRAVQVGQSSFVGRLTAGSEYTQIFSNAFVNAAGAFKYIFNGTATIHEMLNGSFRWLQAPSGTAGDTAPFTQAMTLDASGNLGIGTTSPSSFTTFPSKLVVGTGTGGQHITIYSGTASEGDIVFADGTTGADQYMGTFRYDHADNSMKFYTGGGTLGIVQNPSGNLGLGTAPNAWQAGYRFLNFSDATGGFIGGSAYSGQFGSNAYLNSSATWVYGGGSYKASRYEQFNGYHAWFRSTSTPVINTDVVWSQAMTLNADGTLGIGSTGAGNKLTVSNAGANGFEVDPLSASGTKTKLLSLNRTTSAYTPFQYDASLHEFQTSGSPKMTLDASGNLGVATTSPQGRVNIVCIGSTLGLTGDAGLRIQPSGTGSTDQIVFGYSEAGGYSAGVIGYVATNTASFQYGALIFATRNVNTNTAPTERVRIDPDGNLLVGTTSQGTIGTNSGVGVYNSGYIGVSSTGDSVFARRSSDGDVITFRRDTSSVGSIAVTTVLTTYNTTSDYRLKTVTGSVMGQGERIDALKPIDYQWKEGNQQSRGFLAHEFQTVYPNSVTGEKDAIDADGKPVYQTMQASTAEVIADLVAEIQSLRQRITTLENK